MRKAIAIVLVIFLLLSSVSAFAAEYKDKATVKKVQQALNDAGYDCGKPDGAAGKKTKAAISSYQTDKGLTVSGVIDDELLNSLGIDEEKNKEQAEKEVDETNNTPTGSISMGNSVTGSFDEPALINPEERYETFFEKTDGSEYPMYVLLDQMNDEAKDIEEYGALYITENLNLNNDGKPLLKLKMAIQDSPYGIVMIGEESFLWMKMNTYSINTYTFIYDGKTVEQDNSFSQDDYEYYCESYHFPYGNLDTMNGVRQDENGYNYFFIKSEDFRSFEFVVGENMRIVQLRVYEKNDDGILALTSFVDYDVGPAWEIPQAVLDEMGKVLEPVKK